MAENEPRLNYSQPVDFSYGSTSQQTPIDHRLQQQNPELQLHQVLLPKTVVLRRQDGHGFGFTLRHFIVYPPESCNDPNGRGQHHQANSSSINIAHPMDTVFVKEVRTQGPAHLAGLRTGDRLLAVNGMPVAGTPYARVVTAIQQTPATLTLQVVPKECDILQTFFSETAHNPETNQRYKQQHPQMLVAANIETCQPSTSAGAIQSHGPLKQRGGTKDFSRQEQVTHHNSVESHQRLIPQSQQLNTHIEPFYSNVKNDRIDSDNTSDRIYAEPYSSFEHRNVKAEPQAPMQAKRRGDDLMQLFTRDNQPQQNVCRNSNENNRSILTFDSHFAHLNSDAFDRRESTSSISSSIDSYGSGSTLTSDLGDSAIMTRLRKSFEQKEEFLRRPSQPTGYKSDNLGTTESTVRQREFYARPNRLQKSIWPPQDIGSKNMNSHSLRQNENRIVESDSESLPSTTDPVYYSESKSPPLMSNQNDVAMPLQQKSYNIMSSQQAAKTAAAVKLAKHIAREQFYNGLQQQNNAHKQQMVEHQAAFEKDADDVRPTIMETEENCRHIPTTGLHIVSERAKQFESGRPLSPDGQLIDRTSLYRSELSRLSTKRPVPNVAVRRREFEMKAENSDWRKLSDDNDSSHNYDSADYYQSRDQSHPGVRARSLSADSACDMATRGDRAQVHSFNEDQFVNREFSRKQPYRQNSYIEAVTQTSAEHSEAQVKEKIMLLQKQQQQQEGSSQNEIKFQNRNQSSLVYSNNNKLDDLAAAYNNDNDRDIEMMQMVDVIRKGGSAIIGGVQSPPIRPTTLNLSEPNQVVRRPKPLEEDDDRPMRRVSYLRATANDIAFEIDSDMDQSPMSQLPDTPDNDAVHSLKSAHRPWRRPRFTTDIQPLRRIFEEAPPPVSLPPVCGEPSQLSMVGKNLPSPTSHGSKSKALSYFRDAPADSNVPVQKEGELNVKITFIDGKRSNDRSWKTVWAEIRGNKLKLTLHREGKSSQSPEPSGIIDLRSFRVTDANYTKRKYVFKLTSATNLLTNSSNCGTEILIQAENQQEMKIWMDQLIQACEQNEPAVVMRKDYIQSLGHGSQQAEPQRIAGTTIIESSDDITPPNKNSRRLSLGPTRSPTGQSPIIKTRKTPHNTQAISVPTSAFHQKDEIGSPKSKTWSSVVRSIRRSIQGPVPIQTLPEGASIGAPLIHCPASEENQYIPYIVARCINIVESRGLSVVGIYRIPGNTAAITALTELVNRGFDETTLKDPRWEDVNVVSSLLKLFIRRLPDGLLPNEMYQHFIDADKQTGKVRLLEIKTLLKKLPPHSYETLKILIKHLNCVSHNCDINLMEPRNIAIVFGPSIVRSATDTLETAVKDMKHQCRIVEALVLYYSFFFENDPVPQVTETPEPTHDKVPEAPHTDLLLNNVAKIEPMSRRRANSVFVFSNRSQPQVSNKRRPSITTLDKESSFVANIVQAANRKIRQRAQRKSTTSATPDTVSLDSSTSAESKEHLKRFGSEESTSNSQNRNAGLGDSQKRLSEDDMNDSAFADNGSMSLNTVTLVLDNKLRSLRNQSSSTDNQTTTDSELDERKNKPLSLGENIPYADESPERPIRSKPIRTYTNRNEILPSQSSTPPNSPESSQENISKINDGNDKIKSPSITSSCDDTDVSSTSSTPPTTNTTTKNSNKQSTKTTNNLMISPTSDDGNESATNQQSSQSTSMRIDTEVLREMNQILSDLEKFKTKLNRSLSLNYKNHHKEEYCCCNSLNHNHNHHHHRNNNSNNNSNNYNNHSLSNNNNHNISSSPSNSNNNNNNSTNSNSGLSLRTQNNQNQNSNQQQQPQSQQQNRLSLTKDEKTDKNISKKRQLQDVKYNRRYHTNGSRSIKRRHTVGGTHDYSNKIINCYATSTSNAAADGIENDIDGGDSQQHHNRMVRASSPELVALKKKEIKAPHQEQENTCHY